jgi:phenylpropionate dioxygenase-like ring-hydroxylating dioxygenase large terminal subunit
MDTPLMLVRDGDNLICFLDRCPHRGYPLSEGQIENNSIVCGYHGWRFDLNGTVIERPGTTRFRALPSCLTRFDVRESDGDIWVALRPEEHLVRKDRNNNTPYYSRSASESLPPEKATAWQEDAYSPQSQHATYNYDEFSANIRARQIDIMENFLDPLHTHYIHTGIVRSMVKRHKCQVQIESIKDGYQAIYREEKQQSGFLSRAFGGDIEYSVGRALQPGIVQLDYCSESLIEMRINIFISAVSAQRNRLNFRVYLRDGKLPFFLKSLILRPILKRVFAQDKRVLEKQYQSVKKSNFSPMIMESDVMRQCIDNVLSDRLTPISRTVELEL